MTPLLEFARKTKRIIVLARIIWSISFPYRFSLFGAVILLILSRLAVLAQPMELQDIVSRAIAGSYFSGTGTAIEIVLISCAVQGITHYGYSRLLSKVAHSCVANLRVRMHEHLQYLPIAYHDRHTSGSLASDVMNDASGIRTFVGPAMADIVASLITAVGAWMILFHLNAQVTLLITGLLCLLALPARSAFARVLPCLERNAYGVGRLSGRLVESLSGIRVTRIFQGETQECRRFEQRIAIHLADTLRIERSHSTLEAYSTTLTGVVMSCALILCSANLIFLHLEPKTLLAYLLFLGYVIGPFLQWPGMGIRLLEAATALERTQLVMLEAREDHDSSRRASHRTIRGQLSFVGVTFAYNQGPPVLKDLSFECCPGSVTALVGPSGAGKSTILSLIAAFYRPSSGTILIDGIDLVKIRLDEYRRRLAVVFQEPFLFNGTLEENIRFGRPTASPIDFVNACRAACVEEFADKLNRGYSTVIGQHGIKLSGGQMQRVSIARALLADPQIIILDEATSSLDSDSESSVQTALTSLFHDRTAIVIAHRLSTVREANQILVINDGKIVQRGSHQALMSETGGTYRRLFRKQQGGS